MLKKTSPVKAYPTKAWGIKNDFRESNNLFSENLVSKKELTLLSNSLKASEFYSKQVSAIVDRLTALIEPILIIVVGAVIGIVLVVTYLPIFNFGSALAQ